jgi:hypothetical protein
MADLTTYRIAWDWTKAQPSRLPPEFGPRNEGFLVTAENEAAARDVVRYLHHLNPFYVTIRPVPQVGKE